jgi:hypothetical protein
MKNFYDNLNKILDKMIEIKAKVFDQFVISGVYTFTLKNIHTGEKKVFTKKNLITNAGKNYILKRLGADQFVPGMRFSHCALGTGTTAPTINDTQLQTEIYRNNMASASDNINVGYWSAFYTATETTGAYKEFGIFINGTSTANSGTLFSRVSINITKSNVESLTIDYQLTLN